MVRTLIVFGADVNATNSKHETPRHIATAGKQLRWKEIVDALGLVGAGACHPSNKSCKLDCRKPYQGTCVIGTVCLYLPIFLSLLPSVHPLFFSSYLSLHPSVHHLQLLSLPTHLITSVVLQLTSLPTSFSISIRVQFVSLHTSLSKNPFFCTS